MDHTNHLEEVVTWIRNMSREELTDMMNSIRQKRVRKTQALVKYSSFWNGYQRRSKSKWQINHFKIC